MNDSADGYQPIPLPRLSDLVGQNNIRDRLTSAVKTAQSGGTQVPHILFDGPAGLGKRTFAEVLARELGVSMTVVSGAEFRYVHNVVPYLTNIGKEEILFVDGIDRIPSAAAADYLGSAMRDFVIPLTFGEGEKERLLNIELKKFTLIGASAAPDRINPIIMDQFGIRGHFDHYTHGELSVIIRHAAANLKIPIDDAAVSEIARRSEGTSRRAFNLTRAVRDCAEARNEGKISPELVLRAIEEQGLE